MSKIIDILNARDEFVKDVDGFVYWWPHGSVNGHLASHHLREIADELDRRNAGWNKQIEEYFSCKTSATPSNSPPTPSQP